MKIVSMISCFTLGACAAKELPIPAGHPADPNATSAPAPATLNVLGATFSADAVMPSVSAGPDPHEHHKHGGHEH